MAKVKKKVKQEKELVCLTCIRMNAIQKIIEDCCETCKRMNRKQDIIEA